MPQISAQVHVKCLICEGGCTVDGCFYKGVLIRDIGSAIKVERHMDRGEPLAGFLEKRLSTLSYNRCKVAYYIE